jgi:hypothetical protein
MLANMPRLMTALDGTGPFTLGAEDDILLTEGAGRWMSKRPLPKERKEEADAGRWRRSIDDRRRHIDRLIRMPAAVVTPTAIVAPALVTLVPAAVLLRRAPAVVLAERCLHG